MRNEFLKSFSKTETARLLVEQVLQPDLDEIKDVTKDMRIEYQGATNGEIFLGKKLAAIMIQKLIDDIAHYENEKPKVKDPRDSMK